LRKRLVSLLLALLLVAAAPSAVAELTDIQGVYTRGINLRNKYPDNPVLEGVSSTTGLPFAGPYVPILLVVDNALEARPNWGIAEADIIYQMPNAGQGATKLLTLYADTVPASAGGVRSARVPFVDLRESWDSAFVHAGMPPKTVADIARVDVLLKKYGVKAKGLDFDLLGSSDEYGERLANKAEPHNLGANLLNIKDVLLRSGYQFTQKPFLFTDELPTVGEEAAYIEIAHYGDTAEKGIGNPASWSSFTYDRAANVYLRAVKEGPFVDMNAPSVQLSYSNVIVMRTRFSYSNGDYVILKKIVGSGAADIFTGGRYIAGAWTRSKIDSRTVFVDAKGNEIPLQRGKTFIVVTNAISSVRYGDGI
jgi:hypothetical protein